MRILVVEDEKKVADFLAKGLFEAGYVVKTAYDGPSGERLALEGEYDLILLDVMLPGRDGFQVLRNLRSEGIGSKVLLLTALDQKENKLKGLNLGGDDYLVKPFDFDELLARVNALLRRGTYEQREVLAVCDLTVDKTAHTVLRGNKAITLTQREFMLLEYLIIHKDEVVTRNMIAQHVWNLGFESSTNVIDVYINYLRRKIDDGFECKLIRTIRGRGYMLSDKT